MSFNFNPVFCCVCGCKGTRFNATHNFRVMFSPLICVVFAGAKVQDLMQLTTIQKLAVGEFGCVCGCKGTRFNATHNALDGLCSMFWVVFAGAKVQDLMQLTTGVQNYTPDVGCVCGCKGTRFNATHNIFVTCGVTYIVVFAGAKVQDLMQLTTNSCH